jgi:hypothetical protein
MRDFVSRVALEVGAIESLTVSENARRVADYAAVPHCNAAH